MSDFCEAFSIGLAVMFLVVVIWTNFACWKYINTAVPTKDPLAEPLGLGKVFVALLGNFFIILAFFLGGDLILVGTLLGLGVLTLGLLFLNLRSQIGWKYGILGLAVLIASSSMIILVIIVLVFFVAVLGESQRNGQSEREAQRELRRMNEDAFD